MQAFLQNVRQFLGRLTVGQQVALGLVLAGGTALLITIAYWANQPDYGLLFGNLNSTDANGVVETLRDEGVAYKLSDGGSSIHVPRSQVYELRMRFASEGVVSEGQVGYELFDEGTLGMTNFMQKLNMKRALEGELAQTISNIRQVELSRVHLVIPERKPFRDDQARPSASVVLDMSGGNRLSGGQIQGITSLVAGAVEGMAPADVTVLDTRGNMLSDPEADNPSMQLTSTQLEMQRKVEKHLIENGQSMLDQVLGPNNSILRVSALLDFDQRVTESEQVDPESATVISEERLEEQDPQNGAANSTVRNYDLSRTRERSEKSIGDVSYLTVSVILDHKADAPAADGEQPTREPYTEEELTEIEGLVKNAVGFNAERGDQFAIHQTRFDTSVDDQVITEMRRQKENERIELYVRYGLIALALLLAVWLIRSAARHMSRLGAEGPISFEQSYPKVGQRRTSTQLGAAASGPQEPADEDEEAFMVEDMYTSKLSKEAKARLKAKHKMYEKIKSDAERQPEEAAELIRSWLAEEEPAAT